MRRPNQSSKASTKFGGSAEAEHQSLNSNLSISLVGRTFSYILSLCPAIFLSLPYSLKLLLFYYFQHFTLQLCLKLFKGFSLSI